MRFHELPNARAALTALLLAPMGHAPADAAVLVQRVYRDVALSYFSELGGAAIAAHPALESTVAAFTAGDECEVFEVTYVWYESTGLRRSDHCVGIVVWHPRGGRAYAIW